MKKITVIIIGLLIVAAKTALAGDVQFIAKASKTKVVTGEQFQITFSINTSASAFTPPAINDFRVLGGPNQSTSMQWINGNMSHSITYSYVLLAVKEGKYTIKPARIKVGSEILESAEITIEVVKGNPVPQQSQPQTSQNPQQGASEEIGDNLFLKVSVDKTKAYLGEQITATYKIYTRVNIVNNGVNKLPALNGFWSQDIDNQGKNAQLYTEVVDGVAFNVADLKKTILFPQRTGTLEIDPLALECVVRTRSTKRSQSIFDQFFGTYEDLQYIVKSKPVKIQVLPLPLQGKPDSFAGAVGKFSMEATLDKSKVKAHEAINLNITISGKGNLKLIETPKPVIPSDIESYDPKINDKISTTASGVSGSKTYEYLLIPRHAGNFKIEPVEFSFFDPSTKSYRTLTTGAFEIEVEKGAQDDASIISSTQKEDIKILGSDIRFIKTQNTNDLSEKGNFFFGSVLFYGLLQLPLVLFFIFLFLWKRYLKNNSDLIQVKSRKATKMAARRLVFAKKHLDSKDQKSFYEEVFKALYGYLSDKLSLPVSDLSKETITNNLADQKADPDSIQKLIRTLDLCELARFAPSNNISEQEVYSEAVDIISKIEGELK